MWALNTSFGVDTPAAAVANEPQQAALAHIIRTVAAARPRHVAAPREAARELLGARFDYNGSGCRVRPYGTAPVSLPAGSRPSVPLKQALGPSLSPLLDREMLLVEPSEAHRRLDTNAFSSYLDEKFRKSPSTFKWFVAHLARIGLIGCTRSPSASVSPFFVEKKNNKLRLVGDCREANCFFERARTWKLEAPTSSRI